MSSTPHFMIDPDAPSPAAIDRSLRHPVMFFLTAGAVWLAVALVLGFIASVKIHDSQWLAGVAWLTYGRVFPAHVNALLYGWGMQAAFAVILWLSGRLTAKCCTMVASIVTAGHVWNVAVLLGTVGILSGNGTGVSWMEFPTFVWPVLLVSYVVIVTGSFIQVRVQQSALGQVALWYVLAAMLWFPWVFVTSHLLVHGMNGHPVMAAGVNAWYKSSLVWLFFVPVALGAAYYLTVQITKRPLHSAALSKLGFWSLAVIAPWAGMQKLAGAPVPHFLPYVGAAAAVLVFIPVFAAVANLLRTIWPVRHVIGGSDPLRFTVAGLVSLLGLSLALVVLDLPGSTLRLTQFSLAAHGLESLAMYGAFSLVVFGVVYLLVPRMIGHGWPSGRMMEMHYLFSVYGLGTIGLVTLIGGLQQGRGMEDWQQPWLAVMAGTNPYAVATTFAWALILFANLFFFIHLALMWLHLGFKTFPVVAASGDDEPSGEKPHSAPHAS